MSELLDKLRQDHVNIRWLLEVLEGQLVKMRADEATDYRLMNDIANYFTSYPDLVHHPHEDLMFEHMAERDPGLSDVVHELRQQHEQQASAGKELATLLAGVIAGAMTPRQRIMELTEDYIRRQRRHMEYEEEKVFAPARELLDESDWRRLDEALQRQEDPLFGAEVSTAYQQLYDSIQRES